MPHTFQIPDEIYQDIAAYVAKHRKKPDDFLVELITEAVEQIKRTEAIDPLAQFIDAFDSGENDSGWIEQHNTYFARDSGE